jgi:hypothetical protein
MNHENSLEEAYVKMRRDKINEAVSGKVSVAFLTDSRSSSPRNFLGVFGSLKSAERKCRAWIIDSYGDTEKYFAEVFEIKSEYIPDDIWADPGKQVASVTHEG